MGGFFFFLQENRLESRTGKRTLNGRHKTKQKKTSTRDKKWYYKLRGLGVLPLTTRIFLISTRHCTRTFIEPFLTKKKNI